MQLRVQLVPYSRDGERHRTLDAKLLGGAAALAVLVDGQVRGAATGDERAEHLDELIGGLRLVGVDPAVLYDFGVSLRPVVEALGARALEGFVELFR